MTRVAALNPRILSAVRGAILMLLFWSGARLDAQDDRAERLKAFVDRRLAELRSEIFREIDAAFDDAASDVALEPVSAEFRELHRLPAGAGARVIATPSVSDSESLQLGDVVVTLGNATIGTTGDLDRAFAQTRTAGRVAILEVIRRAERTLVLHPVAGVGVVKTEPTTPETADQMLDRLWNKAVREHAQVALEPIGPGLGGAESRPSEKKPISPERPRR